MRVRQATATAVAMGLLFSSVSVCDAAQEAGPEASLPPPGRPLFYPPDDPLSLGEPSAPDFPTTSGRLDEIAYTGRYFADTFRRMRPRGYLVMGGILAGTYWLARNKRQIQGEVQEDRSHERDEGIIPFKALGEPYGAPAICVGTWLFGKLFDKPAAEDTGFVLMESFVMSGLAATLGQFVFSEQRPEEGGKMSFFSGSGHGVSGHAAVAASLAGPIDKLWLRVEPGDSTAEKTWKRVGKVFAYGLPFMTGLSRLEQDRHYAWNVALGLSIGYSIGNVVGDAHVHYVEDSGSRSRFSRLKPTGVGPTTSPDGAPGVLFTWSF